MVLAHNFDEGQRTRDVQISTDVTFDSMLLTSNTLQGLKNSGFYKPSPIQLHGIPLGKCGFDLLLEAKSGTGKTAVFTVIALEKIDLKKGLQVVILAPTREIAAQVCDVIKQIGSNYEGLQVEVVMGGLSVQEDITKFKNENVHIIVGSPGRLRHLIQDKHINISAVRLLVLDEADKLVEKSFRPDINYIFSVLPKEKQVIMSSATYPESSKQLINKYVHRAQHICPDSDRVLLGIEQKVTIINHNSNIVRLTQYRFNELLKILSQKQFKQCLIFCNYQVRVAELYKLLTKAKWPAEQLYGQQAQPDRLDALKTLREYKCRILIATDLAARGIDASNVDLVINFEPPFEWQTYLHRIGRAGRYGNYGIAITILSEGQEKNNFIKSLESMNSSLNIRYLWNNAIFQLDNNNSSTIVSMKSNEDAVVPLITKAKIVNNMEKLWTTLTCETKNQMSDEIQSFDELLDKLEEFNSSKIETMSNLIDSFKNYTLKHQQENNNDINKTNQHSKMETIPDKDLNQTQKCILQTKSDNASEKKKDTIHEEKKKDMSKEHKTLPNNKDNKCKTPRQKLMIRNGFSKRAMERKPKLGYKNSEPSEKYMSDSEDSLENETDITKALLAAGLPTAFGKQCENKHKKTHHKNNKGKYNNLHRNNYDYKQSHFENVKHDKNENIGYTDDVKENNNSNTINEYNDNYTNLSDEYHNDPGYNTASQFSNVQYNKTSKNSGGESYNIGKKYRQYGEPREQNFSTKPSQNYMNWYIQLKLAVRQIEYATYIEELSKL